MASSSNPIRLEFVVSNGQQFLQGWERLIDGLGDKFQSGMGKSVDKVVEAIGRIETALSALNKTGVFDFADAFKSANDNLNRVVGAIESGNAMLDRMRQHLKAIKDESRGISANTAKFTGAGSGSGGAGMIAVDPAVSEGKRRIRRFESTGKVTTTYGPGGKREVEELTGPRETRGTRTTTYDDSGKAVVTHIKTISRNLDEIAQAQEEYEKFLAGEGFKSLGKRRITRVRDDGKKIYQQLYEDAATGRIATRTSSSAKDLADLTVSAPQYTARGIRTRQQLEQEVIKQLGGSGSLNPIGEAYTKAVTGTGIQKFQRYQLGNGQIATHNLSTGEATFTSPKDVMLQGAGGRLSGVYQAISDELASRGFAKGTESVDSMDRMGSKVVEVWRNAAGEVARVVKDTLSGDARAKLKQPTVGPAQAAKTDADIRALLAAPGTNLDKRFGQKLAAGGKTQEEFYTTAAGTQFRATKDLVSNLYTKFSQSRPQTTQQDRDSENQSRRTAIETDLLARGFEKTNDVIEKMTSAGMEMIRVWKNANGEVARVNERSGEYSLSKPGRGEAEIQSSISQALKFLASGGYRKVDQRYEIDKQGNASSTALYKNEQGGTASLNLDTGQFTGNLGKAQSALQKFWSAMQSGGKLAGKTWDLLAAAPRQILKEFQAVGNFFIKLSGVIYSVKNLWAGFQGLIVHPLQDQLQNVINATEQYREFETAISGVTGGMQKARDVNDALIRSWQNLPMKVKDVQDVARQMAFIPSLTSKIAVGNADTVQKNIEQFATLVSKLSLLDPEQGPSGVLVALREAIAGGEFRSLRFRLEISPQQMARTINKNLSDLAADPELTQKALSTFADMFIGDEAMRRMGDLFTQRMDKLADTWRHALAKVGDSGIFDKVGQMLQDTADNLFKHFESPNFSANAQRISNAFVRILENVAKTVVHVIRRLTNAQDGDMTIAGVFGDIADGIEKLAQWSDNLPEIADKVINFVTKLSDAIMSAVDVVTAILARLWQWLPKGRDLPADQKDAAANDFLDQFGLRRQVRTQMTGDSGGLWRRNWLPTGANAWLENTLGLDNGMSNRTVEISGVGGQKLKPEQVKTIDDFLMKQEMIDAFGEVRLVSRTAAKQELSQLLAGMGVKAEMEAPRTSHLAMPQDVTRDAVVKLLDGLGLPLMNKDYANHDVAMRYAIREAQNRQRPQPMRALGGMSFNALEANPGQQLISVMRSLSDLVDRGYDNDSEQQAREQALSRITRAFGDSGSLKTSIESLNTQRKAGEEQFKVSLEKIKIRLEENKDAITDAYLALEQGLAAGDEGSVVDFIEKLTAENDKLQFGFSVLQDKFKQFREKFEQTAKKFPEQAILGAQASIQGMAEDIKHLGPQAQSLIRQRLFIGDTMQGEAVAKMLGIPLSDQEAIANRIGFPSWSLHARQKFLDDSVELSRQRAESSAKTGLITAESTPQSIMDNIFAHAPGFAASEAQRNGQLQRALQGQLQLQQGIYSQAAAQVGATDGKDFEALMAFEKAREKIAEISAALREVGYNLNYVEKGFVEFGRKVEESLQSSLGDAIYRLISGTGKFRDVLISFAADVQKAFSQMLANNLLRSILGENASAAGGQGVFTSFLTRLFGGGGGSAGGAAASSPEPVVTNLASEFAAQGAVWKGGFTPIAAFASGGVVNRPVLGIVGEGPAPAEAMVPLPDGKHIPVQMKGGSGEAPRIYVVANYAQAIQQGLRQNRDIIVDVVSGNVKQNGKLAKAMRRGA